MKYQKKPIQIEAIQFFNTPERLKELSEFMGEDIIVENDCILIETLEGTMTARVGDYIIKGVKGEFYPCRQDIFEDTYSCVKPNNLGVEIIEFKQKLNNLDEYIMSNMLTLEEDYLLEAQRNLLLAYLNIIQLRKAKEDYEREWSNY